MTRRLARRAPALLLLLALGCALFTARTPLEQWFVARTLWTDAKEHAVGCLATVCRMDVVRAREIVSTIDQGDAVVQRTEIGLRLAEVDGLSELEGQTLRAAAAELALHEGILRQKVGLGL